MRSAEFDHTPGRAAEAVVPEDRLIPAALRTKVLARDSHRCVRCGSAEYLEIDHAIPWAVGGKTTLENLQVLCHGCNMRKACRTWWGPTLVESAVKVRGVDFVERMNRRSRM